MIVEQVCGHLASSCRILERLLIASHECYQDDELLDIIEEVSEMKACCLRGRQGEWAYIFHSPLELNTDIVRLYEQVCQYYDDMVDHIAYLRKVTVDVGR